MRFNNFHTTESKPKPQGTKTYTFKSKPKNLSRKIEIDKKKHGKKTNTAIHVKKRAGNVLLVYFFILEILALISVFCGSWFPPWNIKIKKLIATLYITYSVKKSELRDINNFI